MYVKIYFIYLLINFLMKILQLFSNIISKTIEDFQKLRLSNKSDQSITIEVNKLIERYNSITD